MAKQKLPTAQESIENYAKFESNLEKSLMFDRYIAGCDPYKEEVTKDDIKLYPKEEHRVDKETP